jgi:PilZ domain-containing protein
VCTNVILGRAELGLSLQFVSGSAQVMSRKEPRYSLNLPVSLKLNNNPSRTITAVSENISVHGVLLATESPICEGTEVDVEVTFAPQTNPRTVRFTASGRVLRLEQRDAGSFAIAVSCAEHPFQLSRPA